MKRTSAALLISSLALTGLAGAVPSLAQSPAPPIAVKSVPDPGAPVDSAAPAPAGKAAAKTSGEVLPWANKPLVPMAAVPEVDLAAAEAAAQQCSGLFEAACRDLKTCAWVADLVLQDGTLVPARCAARPPAPPKKAAKKAAPPKTKAAAAPVETPPAAAPAVKAAVTRIEDAEPAAAPVATDPQPATAEKEPEPEVQVDAAAPQEADKTEEKPKKQAEAPIVVKPPAQPESQAPAMPSFGSISAFGGGNAVVVTVPPSSE